MIFRADEAIIRGFERARSYLIPRDAKPTEKKRADEVLRSMLETCGPVVDAYPSWHPLVSQKVGRNPVQLPSESCGYYGLDHTVYFAHGFISCPYVDGRKIIDSALKLEMPHCASIEIEEVDFELYNNGTRPIIVRCEWLRPLDPGLLIPKSLAIPLMLEQEVPVWRWSSRAESWETMRPYLLGNPHGNRSSLFVGQDTGLAIKKLYLSLVDSGMFGHMK